MGKSRLFEPAVVGNMKLRHRMAMAPLTRYRADDDHVPVDLMTEYYRQRSSVPGTLLVTEATFISREDGGYANVPGIYTKKQIEGWKKITDAVHANGSYIFCQLWSLGRTADPEVAAQEGITISGASAIPLDSESPVPKPLSIEEIRQRVQNYAQAAKNAVEAGFDGVELHGANGYILDQFQQACSNQRNDEYGGSVENRARFAIEAVKAVVDAVGANKTAIRLSPWSVFQAMRMDGLVEQFSYFIRKIAPLKLAYLHLVESRISGNQDIEAADSLDFAYKLWDGPLLVAGGYQSDSARKLVDENRPEKDIIVTFGRYFISTPDLPYRIENGLELNPYNRKTFYEKSEIGYIDYPFSKEFTAGNKSVL